MKLFTPDMNDGHSMFVFGSNTMGRHGKGAARTAVEHWGAKMDKPWGPQGQSYAIPTKDGRFRPLPISTIETYVDGFLQFAFRHPEITFLVTPVGTGLAGNDLASIDRLFWGAPANCILAWN